MNNAHLDPTGMVLSGGRYVITAKLGEGGMGAVYRAQDNNLQSDVVIKLPHRSMVTDAEFSRRFRDEVRSLVRLSHPHIVKVTDVGDWDGVPFAVLQFLPGGSLEDRLPAWKGPAALAALGSWLGPVGSALDYVHSQKMVHRDVKPGNILFDAQGHAFLGDFGVVKVLAAAADDRSSQTAMTGTGMVLGTPHYMAPELVMGDPFDGRVDQYALAVTAYELLCGRRPFEHEVPTRVLMMQAQDAPPSLTSHCPWASPRLEATLLKALAKNPDDRYPSCAAFAAAVAAASGVEQPGRARVRCGSCGQTMMVSVEALAKLSRAGRNAPCPKCRSLLDLTAGTATVLPPSLSGELARGGTAILDIQGSTVEMQALRTREMPPPPPPPGGGTVVFGSAKRGTVIEPRPGQVPKDHDGDDEDEPERRPLPWVPIGIATAAGTLIACAALFWAMSSDRTDPEKTATAPASGAPTDLVARNNGNVASIPRPLGGMESPRAGVDRRPVVTPATPVPKLVAPGAVPRESEPAAPVAVAKPGARTDALEEMAGGGPIPDGGDTAQRDSGESEANSPAPTTGQGGAASEPGAEPAPEPKVVADDEKPEQRNVPLAKLLANPEAFAGQLITLEQVYCVGKVPWRMPDGSLRVAIIEADLELTNNSARVRQGDSFELGLDRRLAEQLILQGKTQEIADSAPTSPDWNMQPANLTVKVADSPGRDPDGAARIVRVEMFERFKNEVRGSAKKRLIVLFETQTMTSAGTTSGLGNNDEWQKVKKLGHAYNQFQRFFDGIQRQQSQKKWAAFNSQLNNMIGEGIRQSAASQAELQKRLRDSVTPRFPR